MKHILKNDDLKQFFGSVIDKIEIVSEDNFAICITIKTTNGKELFIGRSQYNEDNCIDIIDNSKVL